MNEDFCVRFSLLAEADFDRIAWFIFNTSGSYPAAERAVIGIRSRIEGLAAVPHQGTLRDEITPGLRLLPLGKAVIAFTVDDAAKTVFVLRLFYGGEDIPSALGNFDNT